MEKNKNQSKVQTQEIAQQEDNTQQELEKKINQLENLVKENKAEISLGQSIKQFEQGLTLAKECMDILDTYKGKIILLKKDADKLIETNWDDNSNA